jgi:acyl-CoA thioesterase-2
MPLPAWDEHDLEALLALDAAGPGRWRSRLGDSNLNGRSYGGQLLGQAMAAALMEAPPDRPPTMMQFLFLQGAMPAEAVDYSVTPLQDGKRFSSRHVRAGQEGRTVLDAQVTCALPLGAPEHAEPSTAPAHEDPSALGGFDDVPARLRVELPRLGGYSVDRKPSIDFRIPEAAQQLDPSRMNGRFRFWMKCVGRLADDPRLHAAAFAYLSDWWLNFSSLGLHVRDIGSRKLYISSLNHALWLHRPPRADEWLHVETRSARSAGGRGLSIGRFHDREGRFVASATQECLMAYVD